MTVQVTALALMVGDSVSRVELETASDAHGLVRLDLWQSVRVCPRMAGANYSGRPSPSCQRRLLTTTFAIPVPSHSLRVDDHSRDSAGMRYVYPVVSRRAGGVSIGINLNPNNACNWRCIYCQVPDLKRGGPPPLDLTRLDDELERFLAWAIDGDFMQTLVPDGARRLVDIAFSGNGEPTSAAEFDRAVTGVIQRMSLRKLEQTLLLRVITNGSLVDRRHVREGLAAIGRVGGEVWFKVDTATPLGFQRVNGSRLAPGAVARRLDVCAGLARTWVQTCVFSLDGEAPASAEFAAYLELLRPLAGRLAGVHLYGLARPSLQPEAPRLGRLGVAAMEELAGRIRQLGLTVTVSP